MATARHLLTLLAALVLVGLSACGDDGEPERGEGQPISFERTGGIAGTKLLLEVRSDREAVLIRGPIDDERMNEFTVSESEFSRLEDAFEAAELDQLEPNPNLACNDCFDYRFRFGPESLQVNGENLPTAAEPIVEQVNAIIERCCKKATA